jgi:hypothetical protein
VPGASEWDSLARVRRGVRNRFSVGRLPAVRTRTTAAAHAAAASAPTDAGRSSAAMATCEPRRSSAAAARKWRSTWRLLFAAQDHSTAPGAQSGRRTTCSTLAPPSSSISRQPLASAGTARWPTAAEPRRSSDEAPPWQRGPAGRRREAAETDGRRDDMAGFRWAATLTTGCSVPRVTGQAQRPCQARRVIDATDVGAAGGCRSRRR